jgi:hypothetical protein
MPTAFLRLPFSFDPAALEADYERCVSRDWKGHFNSADYAGNWDGIALRSASGGERDILAIPDAAYVDTPLLESCPCFRSVIESFECVRESARLLRLAPGSEIKEHADRGAGYADGSFRIHVPVRTNPGVRFRVGGHDLRMEPGECWYADFALPHSVRNEGAADRIHLVIDLVRNDWTDALFREAGYDFEADERAKAYPLEVRIQMLGQLERMDNEGARRLAAQLRLEIEAENRGVH